MEIHHCIHCGTEAQPNWRFCRRCGTGLADLAQAPRVAQCGTCATELADGWRFCPNCGTNTDTATPQQGLSSDDVAELIAAPETDAAELATSAPEDDPSTQIEPEAEAAAIEPAPFEEPTRQEAPFEEREPEQFTEPAISSRKVPFEEPTRQEAPFEEREPEQFTEPAISSRKVPFEEPTRQEAPFEEREPEQFTEPVISSRKVSFDPAGPDYEGLASPGATVDDPIPPMSDLGFPAEPPAPPADPAAIVAEIEARLAADTPPLPSDDLAGALTPEIVDDEILRPDSDSPPAAVDAFGSEPAAPRGDVFELDRDAGTDATSADVTEIPRFDEQPAVVIPPARRGERPEVRTELPTPLGSPTQPSTEIPQPLGTRPQSTWTPTPLDEAKTTTGDLAPTDRLFRDPGLFGQGVQLALLATAAVAVAMVVAHIVLNNRLTDFAETGESVSRVESVESIIGSWLRPLLILALLGVYLATIVWSRRAVSNLAVFRKNVPETAPWMWAIPIVNILVVRQHFDNAWKGSDVLLKDDPDWQKSPGNYWTLGFAALSIATVGVLFYGGMVVDSGTVEGAIDSNAYLMIGYALLAASLLCLVRSITGIVERQHNRARQFV